MMLMFSFNFRFDSDSRPHFRPESVQRFIYFNIIGYFFHKRSVCMEQWGLVWRFTKIGYIYMLQMFSFNFRFVSDSRPHFRLESVQRFIYFNKNGYFFHKRGFCKDHWELEFPFTKLEISIWCWCFLSILVLIRILDLISDPNQSRDSYILI